MSVELRAQRMVGNGEGIGLGLIAWNGRWARRRWTTFYSLLKGSIMNL